MAAMTSYVKRVSRQNSNFVKNGRILTKFDMYVHMGVLSDFMLHSFSKKIMTPWRHNFRFFKVVQSSWNFVKIFLLVYLLILCCFYIDWKSNMAATAAILIFFREFVTTTFPEPQVVETWGFHHNVQFNWSASHFKFEVLRCSQWRLWRHT